MSVCRERQRRCPCGAGESRASGVRWERALETRAEAALGRLSACGWRAAGWCRCVVGRLSSCAMGHGTGCEARVARRRRHEITKVRDVREGRLVRVSCVFQGKREELRAARVTRTRTRRIQRAWGACRLSRAVGRCLRRAGLRRGSGAPERVSHTCTCTCKLCIYAERKHQERGQRILHVGMPWLPISRYRDECYRASA